MDDDLEILFDEEAIEERVRELAEQMSRDYAGKELVLICVLKGAALFTADLARHITVPVIMEFVRAASYRNGTVQATEVTIEQDVVSDIRGKNVIIVDGIVDSGSTLACLLARYGTLGPASMRVAVLLDKRSRRKMDVQIDYRGFEIPDRFVVGYGMDAGEQYRNLPYIAALGPESGAIPVSDALPSGGSS